MHHDEVDMPAVMKLRRQALDLTQPELAKLVGIGTRQIARYEAGEQQPAFNVAVKIADALQITADQLAGNYSPGDDLSGQWWVAWQMIGNGEQWLATQYMDAVHRGGRILCKAPRGFETGDHAALAWTGELRVLHPDTLVGWFQEDPQYGASTGSLYLKLDHSGQFAVGRWTAQIHSRQIETGKFVLDRSSDTYKTRVFPDEREKQLAYLEYTSE